MNWKRVARVIPFLGLCEVFQETCQFSPGDKVIAFGNVGEVKKISTNGLFVEVKFSDFDSIVTFYLDGKFSKWHKEPSLRKL